MTSSVARVVRSVEENDRLTNRLDQIRASLLNKKTRNDQEIPHMCLYKPLRICDYETRDI